ncbi:MAG: DUF5074 domain-containing protein [Bacteroidota bacterium]
MKRLPIIAYHCLLLLVIACKPAPPEPPTPPNPSGRVFILNEGNFLSGNASLDRYDPESDSLQSEVFQQVNQRPLGDVLQSAVLWQDKGYLVVNNSNQVEVVDPDSLSSLGSITGLGSPRYLLPVSDTKAYLSDLYAARLAVVDLAQSAVSKEIPLPGWTEQMAFVAELVWVLNVKRPWIFAIDPQTDAIVDSISLALGCSQLQVDANGQLWIGCSESLLDSVPSRLFQVNPNDRRVVQRFIFPEDEQAGELAMNPTRDSLYYLNQDLFVLPISATELPGAPLIPSEGSLFYGLGVDPQNGDIYLADAIDFVQRGWVLRYDSQGSLLSEFRVGLIPGDVVFW